MTAQLLRRVLCYYFASGTTIKISKWMVSFTAKPFGRLNELLFNDLHFASIEELKDNLEVLNKMFITNFEHDETDWVSDIFGEYKHINTYGEFVFMQQVMKYIESQRKRKQNPETQEVLTLFFGTSDQNEFYQQVNQSKAINGLTISVLISAERPVSLIRKVNVSIWIC